MGKEKKGTALVDCDRGRELGCATFCCRLIVRYDPDQVVYNEDGVRKNCVDKDPEDGLCVHLDKETHRCDIWEDRPSTCRSFDCNSDPALQIILRDGYASLMTVINARHEPSPADEWIQIPTIGE